MEQEALVYDATTGEWSGDLPRHCEVWAQWYADGHWEPRTEYGVRLRDEGIACFRRAIRTGPLKYEKYRLIRAKRRYRSGDSEQVQEPEEVGQSEGSEMQNPFRAGTDRAKVFDILRDGKPRTQKEVDAEYGSPVHRSAMWGLHKGGQKHGYRLVRGAKRKMWLAFGGADEAKENLPTSDPPMTPAADEKAEASPKKAKKGGAKAAAPDPAKPAKSKKAKKSKKDRPREGVGAEADAKPKKDKKDKKADAPAAAKNKGGKKDKDAKSKKASPAKSKKASPAKPKKAKKAKGGKTNRVRL